MWGRTNKLTVSITVCFSLIADMRAGTDFSRSVPEAVIPRSIVRLKVHPACCRAPFRLRLARRLRRDRMREFFNPRIIEAVQARCNVRSRALYPVTQPCSVRLLEPQRTGKTD